MASDWSVFQAQSIIPHFFQNSSLLRKALTAGDTNSYDREGHRGMAQVGDALMSFVILSEGFERGVSRKVQDDTRSTYTSKEKCSGLARAHRFHQLIKISERQNNEGPQPTTLKNTLAAIVAAVWQDTKDYCAVVQVMSSLGLVNYADPLAGSQDQTPANLEGPSSEQSRNSDIWVGESDNPVTDIDFDAFLDAEMLELDWASTGSCTDLHNDWFAVSLPQHSNIPTEFAQLEATREPHDVLYDGHNASGIPANIFDRSVLELMNSDEQPPTRNIHSVSTSQLSPSMNAAIGNAAGHQTNLIRNEGPESLRSTIENEIRLAFKAYITLEARKLKSQPEVLEHCYGHLKSYQEALSSIKTRFYKNLAKMALAIGDCSSMLILKQAIESIRSPSSSSSFRVGWNLSHRERLDIIHRLDLCTAHFRIARWLHIHRLYVELSSDVGVKDADNFIIVTNAHLGQNSTQPPARARRGNPRNLAQTEITRGMMDYTEPFDHDSREQRRIQTSTNRMRRVGYRLQLLVNRWGIAVLCLLGVNFTDVLMMSVPDTTFLEFLDVVDHFEGQSIRAVSDAATSAIKLFMDDSTAHPKLQIEEVDEDYLDKLPRLSRDTQFLFMAATDI